MSEGTSFIIGWLFMVFVIAMIGALVFMLLWNWIIPYIFNGPEISFGMSWGILILVGFIARCFKRNT